MNFPLFSFLHFEVHRRREASAATISVDDRIKLFLRCVKSSSDVNCNIPGNIPGAAAPDPWTGTR